MYIGRKLTETEAVLLSPIQTADVWQLQVLDFRSLAVGEAVEFDCTAARHLDHYSTCSLRDRLGRDARAAGYRVQARHFVIGEGRRLWIKKVAGDAPLYKDQCGAVKVSPLATREGRRGYQQGACPECQRCVLQTRAGYLKLHRRRRPEEEGWKDTCACSFYCECKGKCHGTCDGCDTCQEKMQAP